MLSDMGGFAFICLIILFLPYISIGGIALVTILHFWIGASWWWMVLPVLLGLFSAYIFTQA